MYRNTFDAFRCVFRQEGIRGLYTGVAPTMTRAACLAAGQLASYDHTKYLLGRSRDDVFGHIAASLVAGLCATTAAQPFDTIKSRVMADRSGMYNGMVDCCKCVRARSASVFEREARELCVIIRVFIQELILSSVFIIRVEHYHTLLFLVE